MQHGFPHFVQANFISILNHVSELYCQCLIHCLQEMRNALHTVMCPYFLLPLPTDASRASFVRMTNCASWHQFWFYVYKSLILLYDYEEMYCSAVNNSLFFVITLKCQILLFFQIYLCTQL
jgi:hypothetical protein